MKSRSNICILSAGCVQSFYSKIIICHLIKTARQLHQDDDDDEDHDHHVDMEVTSLLCELANLKVRDCEC